MGGRAFALLALVGTVACTSLDGLTGGDAAVSDARHDVARGDAPSLVDGRAHDAHVEASWDSSKDAPTEAGGPRSDAGSSACPAFAVFCDGFETGNFSLWTAESPLDGPATIAVDGVQHFRGAFAAHASAPQQAEDGSFVASRSVEMKTLPQMSSGLFAMRAYLFLAEAQSEGTALLALSQQASGASLVVSVNSGALALSKSGFEGGDGITLASGVPAPGSWHCLQWLVTLDPSAGNVKMSLDGNPILDASTPTLTATLTYFDQLELGYSFEPGSQTEDAFFDDLAIATQPIDCEGP
jgi:hypothetical protein